MCTLSSPSESELSSLEVDRLLTVSDSSSDEGELRLLFCSWVEVGGVLRPAESSETEHDDGSLLLPRCWVDGESRVRFNSFEGGRAGAPASSAEERLFVMLPVAADAGGKWEHAKEEILLMAQKELPSGFSFLDM